MAKRGNIKDNKKKLTKKEKKQINHLKLIQGKKGKNPDNDELFNKQDYKKSA